MSQYYRVKFAMQARRVDEDGNVSWVDATRADGTTIFHHRVLFGLHKVAELLRVSDNHGRVRRVSVRQLMFKLGDEPTDAEIQAALDAHIASTTPAPAASEPETSSHAAGEAGYEDDEG